MHAPVKHVWRRSGSSDTACMATASRLLEQRHTQQALHCSPCLPCTPYDAHANAVERCDWSAAPLPACRYPAPPADSMRLFMLTAAKHSEQRSGRSLSVQCSAAQDRQNVHSHVCSGECSEAAAPLRFTAQYGMPNVRCQMTHRSAQQVAGSAAQRGRCASGAADTAEPAGRCAGARSTLKHLVSAE